MNDHIKEYLEYYIKLDNPQYAVLLTGKWGCGKTYFIKQIIETWKEPDESGEFIVLNPIYVSLNGISNIGTINERIRAAINPFLYSKGVKIAKNILKGLLKATAKIDIDIDDDEKADGNITFNIDPLGVFNSGNKNVKGKRILIFDDIERCKIDTDEIFGYINNFVEHSKCKVILLADEEKIRDKYKNIEESKIVEYNNFKEKLIGQTFEVKSDIENAIEHFFEELRNVGHNLHLRNFKSLMVNIFNTSGLQNLRVLRQAILDFNRIGSLINIELVNHEEFNSFIRDFLVYFFIVYSEFKTGNIEIGEFQKTLIFEKKEEKSKEDKYSDLLNSLGVRHSTFVFPINEIVKYIESGFIDSKQFNDELDSNSFFRKDVEQNWERIWMWIYLEDLEFEHLKQSVWQDFIKGNISHSAIVFHVAGVFLNLIDEKLFKKNKSYVVKIAKVNLKKIATSVLLNDRNQFLYGFFDSPFGKQYQSLGTPEFIEIKKYFDELSKDINTYTKDDYLKDVFYNLTGDSILDLSQKLKEVIPNRSTTYERTAIFKHIDGKKVALQIKSLKSQSIYWFIVFLHRRYFPEETYSNVTLENYHIDDKQFLLKLKAELKKIGFQNQVIKRRMVRKLIDELSVIISKIENIHIP